MYIENATEIQRPKTRAFLYGQAGMGKTSVVKAMVEKAAEEAKQLKVFVVDVDRSTVVLKGLPGVQVCYLADNITNEVLDEKGNTVKGQVKNPKCVSLPEVVKYLEDHAKEYDLVFFDNSSQLEKNMLTYFGYKGKNDGVPAQSDYQRMQFKIYDYIKRILMIDTNVIVTTWELVGNTVNASTGESGYRLEPQINNKIINYMLGLANIVAHYEKKLDKEGHEKRFLRLSATPNAYAKDQLNGRTWCEIWDLLGE